MDQVDHMQYFFWEMSSLRKPVSHGIEPLDPVRIEAHLRLSGRVLTQWEYNLLIEMDLSLRSLITARR